MQVSSLWVSTLLQFCDSLHLLTYIFINNYIWAEGAIIWCLFPKCTWALALWVQMPDRGTDIIVCLALQIASNSIHCLLLEESLIKMTQLKRGTLLEVLSDTSYNPKFMLNVIMGTVNKITQTKGTKLKQKETKVKVN